MSRHLRTAALACAAVLASLVLDGCSDQNAAPRNSPAGAGIAGGAVDDALARCDRLAADPDDPGRQAPGVPSSAIDVAAAIDACTDAVLAAPGNARVLYQRGRALAAAGRTDEAARVQRAAAALGYAPAAAARGAGPAPTPAPPNPVPSTTPATAPVLPPMPPEPSTTAADRAAEVQAAVALCDRLASDPDDPRRMEAGVRNEDLAVGRAVEACSAAVAAAPGDARMHYQLGRALREAARYDESFDAFVEAADLGYAPAKKALGDAYRWGRGLPPGHVASAETALHWYREAVATGHYPAGSVALAEIEDYLRENTFDPSLFRNPKYIAVLYTLDFSRLDQADLMPFLAYGMGMFEEMDSEQVVDHSPQCIPLQDLLGRVSLQIGGWAAVAVQLIGTLQTSQQSEAPALDLGLNLLGMLWAYGEQKDLGKRDTYNIVNHYGCDNPIGERLVVNLGRMPQALLAYSVTVAEATAPTAAPGSGGTGPAARGQIMRVEALDQVNVRAGPGRDHDVLGQVRNGDRVTVQRSAGGWSFIGSGWVKSSFLVPD